MNFLAKRIAQRLGTGIRTPDPKNFQSMGIDLEPRENCSLIPYNAKEEEIPGIIRRYVQEYGITSPEEINRGNCDELAWDLARLTGAEVIEPDFDSEDGGSHVFVRKFGKFYDIQNPDGVNAIQELEFFKP